MPLENNPLLTTQETVICGNEWDGPWGSISPVPHSVETLCVQIESEARRPRIYFYPYRTIAKWNWNMENPERLEIEVGDAEIIVTGTNLRRLAEALNLGQLRLLQLNYPPDLTGEISIRNISIEDTTD